MAGLKRTDNRGRILKDGETQRKDGTYRYRYVDADGVRRDIYSNRLVPTDKTPRWCKEDVCLRDKEKQIIKDLGDGIKAKVENKATLNDLFEIYMAGKQELKESTRSNYIYMYKKYVKNGFGRRLISKIKYSDVKVFYNHLIHDLGFKPNSIEIIHTILHPVFTLAVRDGYIRVNPTDGAMLEIKRSHDWQKPKRHALTIAEQSAFINYVSTTPMFQHWLPLFTVFLGTGARVGEVLGLRWEDCDFVNNVISINHNLIFRKLENEEHLEYHITTPKSNTGIREIPMLSEVKAALQAEYDKQLEIGFNETVVDGYSGFIFTNRFGGVFSPHVINRAIERIYKSYNKEETERAEQEGREPVLIRHFSVHNLRHTFCTRFCENETNLKVIQEIMGHADIETTMNIYAEATMDKKREAFNNLDGKIRIS